MGVFVLWLKIQAQALFRTKFVEVLDQYSNNFFTISFTQISTATENSALFQSLYHIQVY